MDEFEQIRREIRQFMDAHPSMAIVRANAERAVWSISPMYPPAWHVDVSLIASLLTTWNERFSAASVEFADGNFECGAFHYIRDGGFEIHFFTERRELIHWLQNELYGGAT